MNFDTRIVEDILRPHFGDQITAVASALVRRGRQSFSQIVRSSGLAASLVRKSLAILLLHGIVFHFSQIDGSRQVTYYTIDKSRVLYRVRIPRYIKAAKDMYQDEGFLIVRTVLLHGRLSLNRLLSLIDTRYYEASAVRETFIQLVHDRYLIASDATASLSNLDGRMKREKEQIDALGALPSAKDLRRLAAEREAQAQEELDNAILVGMKRKPGVTAEYANKAYRAYELDSTMYFAVNFNKFNEHFWHQLLIEMASAKINETASKIIRCIIMLQGHSLTRSSSTPFTVSPAQVMHNLNTTNLPMDHVIMTADPHQRLADYMDLLVGAGLLVKDSDKGTFALPNRDEFLPSLQMQYAARHITTRFGKNAARVFRALSLRGKMEDKQLATVCMLSASVARQACYDMHTEGWIELQPIPRTADRAPARSFYVWFIDSASLARTMHKGLLQAICNASERLGAAIREGKQSEEATTARLRSLKRTAALNARSGEEAASSASGDGPSIDDADLETLVAKNLEAQRRLQVALIRLDRDLLIV